MTPEQKKLQAAIKKKWRLNNIERVREINKAYYNRNKEKIAAKTSARYYARKAEKAK